MTQNDLNRAVARATGETVRTIAQLGFGIADQRVVDHDPEPCDVENPFSECATRDGQPIAGAP